MVSRQFGGDRVSLAYSSNLLLPVNSCFSFSSRRFSLAEDCSRSAFLAMLGEEQGEAAGDGSPDITKDSVELELDRVPPFSLRNALQFNSKRLIDLMAKLWPKPTIGNVRGKN